jgi:ABC-type nitrate/sulfonate/bicarbonate transport system permease component
VSLAYRFGRIPAGVVSTVVAIGALSSWELMSQTGFISPLLAPSPTAIVRALIAEFTTGEIGPHVLITLYRVSSGLLIGGTVGVVMGLLMGMSMRLRAIADPFVAAIHPIPKIAILPVVMALLGIGDVSRIAVVSLAVFFPMMINTMNGVLQISPTHLDVARNYGATGTKLFRRVLLPASLPMVMSGLRIGVNLALLITISVEIAGATKGLGALIWISWEVMRIEVLYATLLVIMCFGISANLLVRLVSDLLTPWSVDRRR